MNSNSIIQQFEALPKLVKILILVVFGVVVSGVYRILRYLETKNLVTLVVGVLCFTGVGFIIGIVDAITEILDNRITLFAD